MSGLLGYPALSMLAYMAGCLVFMKGFFPTPRGIGNVDIDSTESPTIGEPYPKLVWMVIDALRSDFTSDQGQVPFFSKMKKIGHLRSYVALAEPPTVTLPRVKALTTGAVPEFLDVLRNYDGGELYQDSVVRRLRQARRRVVFYGDDTWLKLFPDVFLRHDGTHSFFVNDYTEVDNNVTRHLTSELARSDWDVLILHYLGLDHIGHLAGPTSPLIGQKLAEMSDIMEQIYSGLNNLTTVSPPPVLVVCGDHGMSEAGSHGGASVPETHVALHVVSAMYTGQPQTRPRRQVRQLDIAPTLAALLGIPVPAESVGRVLEDAVRPLGARRLASALLHNGRQLLSLYRQSPQQTDADVEAAVLSATEEALTGSADAAVTEQAIAAASGAVQRMQAKLLIGASQHDPGAMALGLLVLAMTVLCSAAAPAGAVTAPLLAGSLLACVAALLLTCGLGPAGRLCAADAAGPALLLVAAAALCVAHLCSSWDRLGCRSAARVMSLTPLDAVLCVGCGLHLVSLGASSFIEEEHQTWYFLTSWLWLLLLCADLRRLRRRPVGPAAARRAALSAALLLSSGLLRRWNQTGDKWLHVADLGDWLTAADRRPWLAAVWAASLLLLAPLLAAGGGSRRWAAAGALCLLLRGLADERLLGAARLPAAVGLWAARTVYTLTLAAALWPGGGGGGRLARLRRCWLLLGALLVRPHNLAVWVGCGLQSSALAAWLEVPPRPSPLTVGLAYHWTGMAALFYMGNSNSLASVDISAGYVGVSGHSATAAVLLTACHTYAGPVLALLTALRLAQRHGYFSEVLHVLVTVRGAVLLVYCCLSTAFLHHIFVWTVFSPKLLYEAAWTTVTTVVAAISTAAVWQRWR